jgi:hypothetical protein
MHNLVELRDKKGHRVKYIKNNIAKLVYVNPSDPDVKYIKHNGKVMTKRQFSQYIKKNTKKTMGGSNGKYDYLVIIHDMGNLNIDIYDVSNNNTNVTELLEKVKVNYSRSDTEKGNKVLEYDDPIVVNPKFNRVTIEIINKDNVYKYNVGVQTLLTTIIIDADKSILLPSKQAIFQFKFEMDGTEKDALIVFYEKQLHMNQQEGDNITKISEQKPIEDIFTAMLQEGKENLSEISINNPQYLQAIFANYVTQPPPPLQVAKDKAEQEAERQRAAEEERQRAAEEERLKKEEEEEKAKQEQEATQQRIADLPSVVEMNVKPGTNTNPSKQAGGGSRKKGSRKKPSIKQTK